MKEIILKLLAVCLCSIAVICSAIVFQGKSSPKLCELTDYPKSTWYMEESCSKQMRQDFNQTKKIILKKVK